MNAENEGIELLGQHDSTGLDSNINHSNSTHNNSNERISKRNLYLAAITSNIISFTAGFASNRIIHFHSEADVTNPFGRVLTQTETDWLHRLVNIGAIIGAIGAGVFVGKIGRKLTLLSTSFPMLISFLIFAFSRTMIYFYIAQFCYGCGYGAAFTVIPIYVGEIATDSNRGAMGCLITVFFTAGEGLASFVGPLFSIFWFYFICVAQLIVFFSIFSLWNPESPQYLAFTNNQQGLEESLRKLRNTSGQVIQNEIASINRTLRETNQTQRGILGFLFQKNFWKCLAISIGSVCSYQLLHLELANTLRFSNSYLSSMTSRIMTNVILLSFNLFTVFFIDKLGITMLLAIPALFNFLEKTLRTLFFFDKNDIFRNSYPWIPILCLAIGAIAVGVGAPILPWALMGKLFSYNLKSFFCTLTVIIFFICQDIKVSLYLTLLGNDSVLNIVFHGFFTTCFIVCFVFLHYLYVYQFLRRDFCCGIPWCSLECSCRTA